MHDGGGWFVALLLTGEKPDGTGTPSGLCSEKAEREGGHPPDLESIQPAQALLSNPSRSSVGRVRLGGSSWPTSTPSYAR